jgi:Zn-dependent protease
MMKSLLELDEIIQILISVTAISFAFTLVFATVDGLIAYPREFFVFMLISLITVGSGFVLHEMSHKLAAFYYGAYARFRMWTNGLIFMLFISLFGLLFAAPGAVYIYSTRITRKENGIISMAGPVLNVILVAVFLALNVVYPIDLYFSFLHGLRVPGVVEGGAIHVWLFGALINLILALFNLIPAFPLDGSKVIMWNKSVWFIATFGILALGLVLNLFQLGFVILWGFIFMLAMVFSKLLFG